jgi:hypothetical protein
MFQQNRIIKNREEIIILFYSYAMQFAMQIVTFLEFNYFVCISILCVH